MIRKRIALTMALCLAACACMASMPEPLAKFAAKLAAAKGVKASYSVMQIGGATEKTSITVAKPNLFKLDDAKQTIVADGTNITFYNKGTKKYFTRKQTDTEFKKLFKNDFLKVWNLFFDGKAMESYDSKVGADVSRRGMQLRTVKSKLDAVSGKSITLFIDKKDDLVKQMILEPKAGKTELQLILDIEGITVSDSESGEAIAFKAPQGSEEINEADLISVRWVTSLAEAKELAQSEGKMILIDFFATWCGPCKMLESQVFTTEEFKALSSKFVFCRIDVDEQTDIAAQFKIEAMPTTIITDANGSEKGRFLGYMPPTEYLEQVKQIVGF